MNIQEQEIHCVIECKKEISVFDADNIQDLEEQDKRVSTKEEEGDREQNISTKPDEQEKQLQVKKIQEVEVQVDVALLTKIEDELKQTKQGFFGAIKENKHGQKPKKLAKPLQLKIAEKGGNSILKQGWMMKKTDGMIFKWKRRFFTLTPQKLYFFEDERKTKVIGCVNIKIMPLQVKYENGEIILDFMEECQNIIMKGISKQDGMQWKDWLEQVAKFQSKEKKLLLKTMNKPFYKEQNTISESEFLDQAQIGDILLFHTKHLGAKVQRALTGSEYDHVAMVVKFRKYEVMIFESNPSLGVSLFQWSQFVRCFNLYEKITYRKLISPRKFELEHNLLKFVKINLGRKYDISLSKLITFQSNFSWELVNQDVARGYFCSELIAKAYKAIGLLDPIKSSCRYWPVDFSQKSDLNLKKGVHLGPEQIIVLNKHVKKMI